MGFLGLFSKKKDRCVIHQEVKCPNCKKMFNLTEDVDRCPHCGVHVESMLSKKCPNCHTRNRIFAIKCEKCGFDFCQEKHRKKQADKPTYRCPYCGYKAGYMFDHCPICKTRIYW